VEMLLEECGRRGTCDDASVVVVNLGALWRSRATSLF